MASPHDKLLQGKDIKVGSLKEEGTRTERRVERSWNIGE